MATLRIPVLSMCGISLLLLGATIGALPGCPVPDAGPAEGEGEGEGEGEPALRPGLAAACDDTPCRTDELCVDLDGDDGPLNEGPACFAACEAVGAGCVTSSNRTGTCTAVDGQPRPVCLASSVNLDGCGNRANAACEDGAVCAVLANLGGVRTCVRPCDPANPSTCLSGTEGCGCDDDEVCTSSIRLQSGDNVCAPPAGFGATCGIEANGDIHPCDSGRQCVVQGAPYPGSCG